MYLPAEQQVDGQSKQEYSTGYINCSVLRIEELPQQGYPKAMGRIIVATPAAKRNAMANSRMRFWKELAK
jgi:hypothetical protein